ncbi:MAG TPA: PAS domain-containing protein [Solirubrobacteraceae bacterium]
MHAASGEQRPGAGAETASLPAATLRAAFDALPEAALIVDRAGCVQYANALAHRLLGEELVLGQSAPWSEPDPEPTDAEVGQRTLFTARVTGATLRRTTASLADIDALLLIVLTVVSTADAAYQVRDSTERLNEVEATAQLGSWSWDIEADVVSWSDELYRIHGLAPQSMPMSYASYLALLHPDDRAAVDEVVQRCYAEAEPYVTTHRVVLPDGSLRWHQGIGRAAMVDGRPVRMFGTGQDITDRVLGEQALRQSLEEAQRLAAENAGLRAELEVQLDEVRASRARIVQAVYEARRQLERDLHDGAQQRLTLVEMTLRSAVRQLSATAESPLQRTLGQAVEELSAGAAELRSLARGLHPALLTERGLTPALEALANRSQVQVTLRCDSISRLDPSIESAAYFVVSEALTNVMKHAGASHVYVTVEQRDHATLLLEVRDDGSGGASLDAGGGLRGLSDRVAALDGRLELDSPGGRGTLLRVELPCG